MTKYYVDTCIWIDYWENRQDNFRPLGEFALKFFTNLRDDDIVYYSEFTLKELRNKYSGDVIVEIFKVIECKLLFIESDSSDFRNAEIITRTGLAHTSDALHITLARRLGAKLITRDKQMLLSGLVDTLKPEDLV